MVEHTVCPEQDGFTRMKILSVHKWNHTPGLELQVFARESGLQRCHGHHVLPYQGIPALQAVLVGAWD
jgi:hypothetical protein